MQNSITIIRQKNSDYKARVWLNYIFTAVLIFVNILLPYMWLILYCLLAIILSWALTLGLIIIVKVTIDKDGFLIDMTGSETRIPWSNVKRIENIKEDYGTHKELSTGRKIKGTFEINVCTKKEYILNTPKYPLIEKSGIFLPKLLNLTTFYYLKNDLKKAFIIINYYANKHNISIKDDLNWL